MKKTELSVNRTYFIILKITNSVFAIFLTAGILIILKESLPADHVTVQDLISIKFILSFVLVIICCIIDYFIIETIIMSKMIYYDDSGITAGTKKISWDKIINVKITYGHSPVLKIKYNDNGAIKNVIGLLRYYPSKRYINTITEIFRQNGVMIGRSLI